MLPTGSGSTLARDPPENAGSNSGTSLTREEYAAAVEHLAAELMKMIVGYLRPYPPSGARVLAVINALGVTSGQIIYGTGDQELCDFLADAINRQIEKNENEEKQ